MRNEFNYPCWVDYHGRRAYAKRENETGKVLIEYNHEGHTKRWVDRWQISPLKNETYG